MVTAAICIIEQMNGLNLSNWVYVMPVLMDLAIICAIDRVGGRGK
jgi:hypothetical protein